MPSHFNKLNKQKLDSLRALWSVMHNLGLCPNQTLNWYPKHSFYGTVFDAKIADFYKR